MKVTTSFTFSCSRRLVGATDKKLFLHGINFKVDLIIKGCELDSIGMLWDFTNTKKLKDKLCHKTILKVDEENIKLFNAIIETCSSEAVYMMRENPTAENLCDEILKLIEEMGVEHDIKVLVRVWENSDSYAEKEGVIKIKLKEEVLDESDLVNSLHGIR